MEIELPDGTVLDAPDGADPKQVVSGYRKNLLKARNPEEYDPNSEAFADKYGPVQSAFREGIGSGMVRMNRGLSNAANKVLKKVPAYRMIGSPDLPGKEFYGDEAIRTQDQLDAPISRTGKGSVGQALGGAAVAAGVTAPLGGLGALRGGTSVLTRTLAASPTRAALEGAIGGAGAADPDKQKQGAGEGAVTAAIIDTFLRGAGRATRGLVQKNEAVRDLEEIAGRNLDFPLSQSASDEDAISRGVRAIYQEGIPNVLGVKGRLARQSKEAIARARNLVGGDDLGEAILEEVANEPVTRGTRTGRILTTVGLGGAGVYGDPVIPLVTLLGGNAMATQTVQRALTGDTMAQRTLARIIDQHPDMIGPMQQLMKQAGAAEAARD